MAEVYAIKDMQQVIRVKEFLLKHYGTHYSDMWTIGINMALRISDLLSITTDEAKKALKDGCFVILEKKTAYKTINKGTPQEVKKRTKVKPRVIELNKTAKEFISERLSANKYDKYLFQSHSNRAKGMEKPLSRQAAYYAFKAAGEVIGVKIGTHTMRKTMGYLMHKAGVPIEEIAKFLNHSSPAITMRYIGLEQEATAQLYHDYEVRI